MKKYTRRQQIRYFKKMRIEHPLNKELSAIRITERKASRKKVTFKKITVIL